MPPAERPGLVGIASAASSTSSGSETTMTMITVERLVEELANVVVDPEDARNVAKAAGFAPARIPVFRMPDLFWNAIVEAAGHGAIAGKVQAVADAAAKLFPTNDVFKRYRAK